MDRGPFIAHLLAAGSWVDINTRGNTREPASVLHLAAVNADYATVSLLPERGMDTTIRHHRWNATAQRWAYHVGKD